MISSDFELPGTGWKPEKKSRKDLNIEHDQVMPLLEQLPLQHYLQERKKLPASVDLRRWSTGVKFQGGFNTCAAHVVATLLGYFEKRAYGRHVPPSRLFLYKVAKNFLQETGDDGVYIRQVMGVLSAVGVPPEKYWPYLKPGTLKKPNSVDARIDVEPTPFCYAVASDYKAIKYYRLDHDKTVDSAALLRRARSHLASQLPFAFGIPLYPSITHATISGKIPYPEQGEKAIGNHAVVAMGYSDNELVENASGTKTRGALLVQNSWSKKWGREGFGWLPYEYITGGLANDFWSLTHADWLDTAKFKRR